MINLNPEGAAVYINPFDVSAVFDLAFFKDHSEFCPVDEGTLIEAGFVSLVITKSEGIVPSVVPAKDIAAEIGRYIGGSPGLLCD